MGVQGNSGAHINQPGGGNPRFPNAMNAGAVPHSSVSGTTTTMGQPGKQALQHMLRTRGGPPGFMGGGNNSSSNAPVAGNPTGTTGAGGNQFVSPRQNFPASDGMRPGGPHSMQGGPGNMFSGPSSG